MTSAVQQRAGSRVAVGLIAFAGLVAFYLLTAPQNHATAIDAYSYAHMIRDQSILAVPELRLFLWIACMQVLHAAVAWVVPNPDTFAVIGTVNAVEAALAVVLFERMLSRRLGLARPASCLTAAMFAFSYGTWRFAAEVEVYSAAALISVALVDRALALNEGTVRRPLGPLLGLAALGALATLCYQPLGIVAAAVIPTYLLARRPLAQIVAYYAVAGIVVVVGLGLATWLDHLHNGAAAQFVLDTDGTPPTLPDAAGWAKTVVAFFADLVSVNWAFAFAPTRAFLEQNWMERFARELFSAENAGMGYLVFWVTLPAIAILLITAGVTLLRKGRASPIRAIEVAALVWLAAYVAMVGLLAPGGFEAWIPALPAFFILFGLRVVGPLADRGGTPVAIALLAVFMAHNWFAGIRVVASGEYNYYQRRAAPVIAATGPGDLIVVVGDWEFSRYLTYSAEARTILVQPPANPAARELLDRTLASGGKVILFDDSVTPGQPIPGHHALATEYLDGAGKIELGVEGQAYQLRPSEQ